jgi:DNA polymerase (family 10)
MASYMQMQSDQKAFFRSRAFSRASEVISKFSHDFADPEWYTDIEKLKKIEGIGQSTAEHIQEFVKTGKIKDYEQMKKESPVKLEELLKIQGIGPKKILKLYKELNVTDIKSLEKVANAGKIATLEGFGFNCDCRSNNYSTA